MDQEELTAIVMRAVEQEAWAGAGVAVRALEEIFRSDPIRTLRMTGGDAADICRLFAVAIGSRDPLDS